MKNFYYAVVVKENEKYYSYVKKYSSNNLLPMFERLKRLGAVVIHPCHTKKHASELVVFWNDAYKANGTYMFDEPNF